MITIALLGAGGKMGCRIIDHLKDNPHYKLHCVETGERGVGNLSARGLLAVARDEAIRHAEVIILALPDRVMGAVAREVAPRARPGTIIMMLDPAVAHAGEMPERADISYFISHPCHPSFFDHFIGEQERLDFFGGVHARQAIVCALMQGPEEHYAAGEQIARDIYAPITRSHRITVEQMAILEPTMAETVCVCLMMTAREALEEAVRRGVPRAAAEDFILGHIKIELAITFGQVNFPFSDGAQLIAEHGRRHLIKPDWKKLFEPESVREQAKIIVEGKLPG